ncbi:Gfo/Idh/MocA family oxidoreductase [Lutibacter sp. A80]|uniref:Gfo/Idh/MocA family protein n=1 Tax=Lutibacter sp. A80 TaxID=2918453 RepID=UPI001F061487|nr:Gfo/Idh/MocA family oxidoreductase [Lutibacter sp. A80]UMB60622.1 Gfo/Idh/MocA family oxidoreductase [Lutibacter sp. A80]
MNRRKFLEKSSLATAAVLTSSTVLGNMDYNFNKEIKIGVIGTGARGCGLISIINKIENLNVTAISDILPFRLQNGLDRTNGTAKTYSDYKQLLNDKNIDAILISVTFSEHHKIAMDAIKAGKHVYCEKTMVKGYDGILELSKKVKNSNIIFQTGHQYHSSRLYTHVVDLIKNGKVGKITSFQCQWNRNGNWRRPVPDPSLEKAINWRMYKEFSGGLTAELSSHQIDFVNWVLEATPEKVMGMGGVNYWKDGRETFDNTHLIYNYPNGVKASFTCLTSNAKDGYQIKVLGDKGTITLGTGKAWFSSEEKQKSKLKDVDGVSGATAQIQHNNYGEPINIEHKNPTQQALLDFRDNILNNTTPLSNVITGGKTAICVQMGIEAMHKNEIIYWKPEFNI